MESKFSFKVNLKNNSDQPQLNPNKRFENLYLYFKKELLVLNAAIFFENDIYKGQSLLSVI